jgi:enoyl-CoA hydratase
MRGVPLIDGGTVRLPRIIGLSKAMDLILTGRLVSSEEAFQMGLAQYSAKEGETAIQKALEIAALLCSFPQECMRIDRLNAMRTWDGDEKASLGREFDSTVEYVKNKGYEAGTKQFFSKSRL